MIREWEIVVAIYVTVTQKYCLQNMILIVNIKKTNHDLNFHETKFMHNI